jgi:hypothetical protein
MYRQLVAAAGVGGFWSYAHADESAETGRITQLARNLQEEYSLITGQEIQLFLDRDDLTWGDNWRKHIDEALAGITFFIPILTPRYFQSEECRRELLTFTTRAARRIERALASDSLHRCPWARTDIRRRSVGGDRRKSMGRLANTAARGLYVARLPTGRESASSSARPHR